MKYENLIVEAKENIGEIILNRPQTLNAINLRTLSELREAITFFKKDKSSRVLIITGAGKAFCAGADVKWLATLGSVAARNLSTFGQETFGWLERLAMPVIAAVNGYAFGGGCELALACDWIFAAESARFGQPEIKLGVIPDWGATRRLPKRVGIAQAKELILTGKIIDAQEAYQIGLVNKVFPDKSFMEEVEKIAKELAGLSPLMLKAAKEVIGLKYDDAFSVHVAKERDTFGQCFDTHDQKEGMKAFLEKRKPKFEGK